MKNDSTMTLSDQVRKKLERIAEEAYWSINKPFTDRLKQIGEILCKYYFPDKKRKTIIVWKNLDAKKLAQPFEKLGHHLASIKISTQRLNSVKREIKNIEEVRKRLKNLTEKADVLLILDAVAGSGRTALKIKEEVVKSLGYEPTVYFYSIFGSVGLEARIKEHIENSKIVKEYPMDESFNPPRLKWFIMSDLGDRYPERNKGGLLIETPLDERKWIKKRVSQFFSSFSEHPGWTTFEERLIINMIDLCVVGGAIYLAQKDARQYGFQPWILEDSIIALVSLACKEEPRLEGHYELHELQKSSVDHIKNESISTFLRDFRRYGYFIRKKKKNNSYWRLPDCMMTYFSNWISPLISSKEWFIKMRENSYYAIANPRRLISCIRKG